MVSQAQRWVASGVSMGRNRRTANTLQLRAVNLKWPQSTKNLTPEGAPKAAETLNSSYLYWTLALLGRSSGVGHQLCQTLLQGPGIFGGSCACAPSWIIVPP